MSVSVRVRRTRYVGVPLLESEMLAALSKVAGAAAAAHAGSRDVAERRAGSGAPPGSSLEPLRPKTGSSWDPLGSTRMERRVSPGGGLGI